MIIDCRLDLQNKTGALPVLEIKPLERSMDKHITILGVLNIVWGAMGALAGLIVLLVFGGAYGVVGLVTRQQPETAVALPFIAMIGGAISLFLLVISAPSIIAGIGLYCFKPWARLLAIIVSVLHLLNVPLGTALGIYGLWVLFSNDSKRFFPEPR